MTAETPRLSSVDRATALTEELIERGSPWNPDASWSVVLAQGVIAIVLGLVFLLKPLGGSSTTLQAIGLILVLSAVLDAFQLWRGRVSPERVALSAFRAGSGVSVGLVVVVATFITAVTETVSASLAVVVGVGFLIVGLVGIAAALSRPGASGPAPVASLVANVVLVVAGAVIALAGASGANTVDTIFNLLGILLIIGGLGLGGYSYLLRQQEASGARA